MALIEDASGYRGEADRTISPRGESELAAVLREAAERKIPVTLGGAGTGVTGGRVPHGGWYVALDHLNALEVRNGSAVAGPGAGLDRLHAEAGRTGQLYPPDPTEWTASVGGTIATNASGSRSFLYGSTRRYIERMRVVFMGGDVRVFRRGDRVDFPVPDLPLPATTKFTAGYPLRAGMDWIDLITGSEGTLCAVTEAELRLIPAPRELLTGVIFFRGDEAALDAVEAWREVAGLRMLEYLDGASLDLLRPRFPDIAEAAGAALMIEQELSDASDPAADEWAERLEAAAGALGEGSWFAAGARDRERFRRFRHALPECVNDTVRRNGFLKSGSDFAVPITRNREMMRIYRERLDAEYPGASVIFGHIGDAHVHVNLLPQSQKQFERGAGFFRELAAAAASLGGTVSAEHGLGKRKAHLLELQFRPAEIEAMKAVKRRLDPDWLLGRGTLFPVAG